MNIIRDTPFTARATHSGVDTTSYTLSIDASVVDTKPVSALVGGTIEFARAGLPAGLHTVVVTAVGPGGSTSSDVLSATAVYAAPDAPTNVELI